MTEGDVKDAVENLASLMEKDVLPHAHNVLLEIARRFHAWMKASGEHLVGGGGGAKPAVWPGAQAVSMLNSRLELNAMTITHVQAALDEARCVLPNGGCAGVGEGADARRGAAQAVALKNGEPPDMEDLGSRGRKKKDAFLVISATAQAVMEGLLFVAGALFEEGGRCAAPRRAAPLVCDAAPPPRRRNVPDYRLSLIQERGCALVDVNMRCAICVACARRLELFVPGCGGGGGGGARRYVERQRGYMDQIKVRGEKGEKGLVGGRDVAVAQACFWCLNPALAFRDMCKETHTHAY